MVTRGMVCQPLSFPRDVLGDACRGQEYVSDREPGSVLHGQSSSWVEPADSPSQQGLNLIESVFRQTAQSFRTSPVRGSGYTPTDRGEEAMSMTSTERSRRWRAAHPERARRLDRESKRRQRARARRRELLLAEVIATTNHPEGES